MPVSFRPFAAFVPGLALALLTFAPAQIRAAEFGHKHAQLTEAFNPNNAVSVGMTLDGDNSFQVGKNVIQFTVNVRGGDIYGRMPKWAINGPDDTGFGHWVPTTRVDEYSATFASWFGESATNLSLVRPNIGRCAKPNLGFLG